MKILLCLPLLLLGCESNVQYEHRIGNSVHYFKDPRTNLCFGGFAMSYDNGVMTNVPCTPEVERLIEK